MRQTLKKHERLHGKKTIDDLFAEKISFFSYPFIVCRRLVPANGSSPVCAALFIVSKKRFAHAVQRNLLKRRMREVFRKNKYLFYPIADAQQCNLHLAFIYAKTKLLDYATLEKKMTDAFKLLLTEMEK